MNELFFILLGIFSLFILLLAGKTLFKVKLCVICVSVSLTWLTLLILYKLLLFENPVILALLMGMSITGIYYLLERKTPGKFHIFRLPLILSLIFIFYLIIKPDTNYLYSSILIIFVWLIFTVLFLFRETKAIHKIAKKIIACCSDW